MLAKIRKSRFAKFLAMFMALNIMVGVLPTELFALTGGPSQPEVESFSPVGVSDLVNVFSGDFSYNIPLLDVGGYPINIFYDAGISMDQEASWVGLGWNLNPGVINRNMRGLPDDFQGDKVKKTMTIRDNNSLNVAVGVSAQALGIDLARLADINFGFGINYNTYKGIGFSLSLTPSIESTKPNKGDLNIDLGMKVNSSDGVDINPSVSFDHNLKEGNKRNFTKLTSNIGLGFNSMAGLHSLNMGISSKRPVERYVFKTGKFDGNDSKSNKNKRNAGYSSNGGGRISFASPSYTPQINMPMNCFSTTLEADIGVEVFGFHPGANISGAYTTQYIKEEDKVQSIPAYGYIYNHKNLQNDKVLLDFNRENDGAYMAEKPNLPLTNYTYDIYSVSGQGIGGMYRPYRGNIEFVYDSYVDNLTSSLDLPGVEVGPGFAACRLGINGSVNECFSRSGCWLDDNDLRETLSSSGSSNVEGFEPFYFKQAGEKNVDSDISFMQKVGSFEPVEVSIDYGNNSALSQFEMENGIPISTTLDNPYRLERQKRNEVINILTADQAVNFALEKTIKDYSGNTTFAINTSGQYTSSDIPRTSDSRKGHHISEITTYRPDGTRYVYGIPAYNNSQKDAVFSIQDNLSSTNPEETCYQGLISYNHGSDNSLSNTKGADHSFSQTELPPYAHSYFLTALLSVDYVDKTGDGPSDDDIGTYTKFNYKRADAEYNWRIPYEAGMANYMEGMKSKPNEGNKTDDKASYTYGKKEVWYLHSIETKTHLAEFHTNETTRKDLYEVIDEKGGRASSNSSCKLDKIVLYNKQDKIKNTTPTPIKTVHFEYYNDGDATDKTNTLCKGIPNSIESDNGKLTLKKVYFTYGSSKRGKLNAYEFTYGEFEATSTTPTDVNPDYNMKEYDRWGTYQVNSASDCECDPLNDELSNPEFPYTNQELNSGKTTHVADLNATAWNLTGIDLPSGGTIKIDYEADDYAYVQNKRAMEMLKVVSCVNTKPTSIADVSSSNNKLFATSPDPYEPYNYLIFKLPKGYTPSSKGIKHDLFTDKADNGKYEVMKYLYFKFLIKLQDKPGTEYDKWEYIPGYCEIDLSNTNNYGLISSSNYAYVRIEDVEIPGASNKDANPISMAAWNFLRLYNPDLAYDVEYTINENGEVKDIFEAILKIGEQIEGFISGFYDMLRNEDKASLFVLDKSWIRLYSPEYIIDDTPDPDLTIIAKKGGGHRVKKIEISDNWDLMTSSNEEKSTYGQEYDYTTTNELGQKISSGVASYEPLIGSDENPFKQPIHYSKKNLLAADNRFYLEEPFGEMFFPGASVGYSKVSVKSIRPDGEDETATGKVVHEFYTAKDYPVKVSYTSLKAIKDPLSKKLLKVLDVWVVDKVTVSQGYCIELNDMHGKQKAQWIYAEGQEEPISGVEYKYKEDVSGDLSNYAKVINKDGTITTERIGVDHDFIVDMRQQETEALTGGLGGNLDAFVVGILPLTIPVVLPSASYELTRFRSAVCTKVINRYGLVDEVIAHDQGAEVSTKNTLFDAETGEVVLTETYNSYKDPIYSFTYPAYWAYHSMGPAYQNIAATVGPRSNMLRIGDEVYEEGEGERLWVSDTRFTRASFIDRDGKPVTTSEDLTVLRSNARNMQNLNVGTISMKKNPIQNNKLVFTDDDAGILSAGAVEYTDESGLFCVLDPASGIAGVTPGEPYNPFIEGAQGNWKVKREWAYLTDRTQTNNNGNTNMRTDGTYTDFTPFWTPKNGLDWNPNPTSWTYTQEGTLYSPYGIGLESRDALGRYSSVVVGYNNTVIKATAANAQYSEIAFDGFEDYDVNVSNDPKFSYEASVEESGNGVELTTKEAHTGRNSIEVSPKKSAVITKKFKFCE